MGYKMLVEIPVYNKDEMNFTYKIRDKMPWICNFGCYAMVLSFKMQSMDRSNPTTAARNFYHRVQCFFTDVILSPACPLGNVTRYFYCIAFQQRGSPHVHCVIWIENEPQPSDSRKTFVNLWITISSQIFHQMMTIFAS